MFNNQKRSQNNNIMRSPKADIAKLDFHDFFGRLQDRIKANTTQKPIGVMMMDKLIDRFGLSQEDINKFREELRDKSKKEFLEMEAWAKTRPFQPKYTPFGNLSKPKSIFDPVKKIEKQEPKEEVINDKKIE